MDFWGCLQNTHQEGLVEGQREEEVREGQGPSGASGVLF